MGTGTRCPLSPAAAEAQPGVPSRNSVRGYLRAAGARQRQHRRIFRGFFCFFFFFPGLGAQLRSLRVAGGAGTGGGWGPARAATRSPPLKKAWKLLFLIVILLRELDFFVCFFGLGFFFKLFFYGFFRFLPLKKLVGARVRVPRLPQVLEQLTLSPCFPSPFARAEGLLVTRCWLLMNPRNCFA